MSFLPRKENGKVDVKAMWEYKLIRFVIMFFVYLMLLIYSIAGAQSVWKWSQLRYYGGDYSLEHLPAAIESLSKKGNQLMLIEYIGRFPGDKNDAMVESLLPLTPDLHAHAFFAISNRYGILGEMEEAMFWAILGRYRLRFDALRCDFPAADVISDRYAELYLQRVVRQALLNIDETTRKRLLQKVVDWTDEYPADNDPAYFCEFIESAEGLANIDVVPRDQWPALRTVMKKAALRYIESDAPAPTPLEGESISADDSENAIVRETPDTPLGETPVNSVGAE